jgi:hypothetical protein
VSSFILPFRQPEQRYVHRMPHNYHRYVVVCTAMTIAVVALLLPPSLTAQPSASNRERASIAGDVSLLGRGVAHTVLAPFRWD